MIEGAEPANLPCTSGGITEKHVVCLEACRHPPAQNVEKEVLDGFIGESVVIMGGQLPSNKLDTFRFMLVQREKSSRSEGQPSMISMLPQPIPDPTYPEHHLWSIGKVKENLHKLV